VENLFPLSSAATPCGTNRNLQQENHSNFTVASRHSPNTMAPRRHHDIRRDLPPSQARPSTPLQIPDPHGSQLVGRACVDQVVADFSPTRVQTRKPESLNVTKTVHGNLVPANHLCCPTWQHFYFITDLPQLAGRCRGHEGCTPQGRHETPAAARRSQCISQFAHGPLLGHLERIDLKLRPSSCCRYGRRVSERPTCHPMWQQTHSPTTIPRSSHDPHE